MEINPENRAIHGLSTFIVFVALNLVYLVTCIPIVTIGAATSALYEVTLRYSYEEGGRPLSDFFPAFGRNFVPATAVSLSVLVPTVALAFSAVFWFSAPEPLLTGLAVIALLAAGYLLAAFLHGMALVAVFRNTVRQTLKNALLLPAAEPVRTFGILAVPIIAITFMVVFPPTMLLVGTIGFSVGAYVSAFIFRSIYKKYGV